MGDLGLFSPANPATYSNPLEAYIAAHVKPTEGTCDFPGAVLVSADTPDILETRGAVLFKTPGGQYYYGQHPCLVGYATNPWSRWDTDGTLICDFYQTHVL